MFRFVRLLFLNAYSGLLAAQAIPPRSMVTLVLAPSSRTQPLAELQRTMTGEREGEVCQNSLHCSLKVIFIWCFIYLCVFLFSSPPSNSVSSSSGVSSSSATTGNGAGVAVSGATGANQAVVSNSKLSR